MLVPLLLLLLSSLVPRLAAEIGDESEGRRLANILADAKENRLGKKRQRLQRLLKHIDDSIKLPAMLKPEPWCKAPNTKGNVIIAAAMSVDWGRRDAELFFRSLRNTGYKEDVVVPIMVGSSSSLIETLKEYDAIAYAVKTTCDSHNHFEMKCTFDEFPTEPFSVNMMRYYLYKWLAAMYSSDSIIMISDFRDVLFQSNPFNYRPQEWKGNASYPRFVAFQEAFPNRVIYRCPFNGGWIRACYGEEALGLVGGNTVSCSGVSIGTRDAIVAYSHLILQQLKPEVRWGKGTKRTNGGCTSTGMDQGFHNWLVFSGALDRFMDIKVYQQGEGPVNTVGSFFPGPAAILKFPLEQWRVLRGEGNQKAFYNWNGDISPVVHQMDRFYRTEFKGNYGEHLKFADGIKGVA